MRAFAIDGSVFHAPYFPSKLRKACKKNPAKMFSIRKCISIKIKLLQEILLIFEISTPGRKCIPNMFHFKVCLNFLIFLVRHFFKTEVKGCVKHYENGINGFQLSFRGHQSNHSCKDCSQTFQVDIRDGLQWNCTAISQLIFNQPSG